MVRLLTSSQSSSDWLIWPPTGQPSPLPSIQMQKLPPQQAGKQQVHTYSPYSSKVGLQVRPEKQLQKYGRLAVPKAAPPLWTVQTLIISTAHPLSLSHHHQTPLSFFHFLPFRHCRIAQAWHFGPLCSLSPARQRSLCILSCTRVSDEVIYMHSLSSSTQHGQS